MSYRLRLLRGGVAGGACLAIALAVASTVGSAFGSSRLGWLLLVYGGVSAVMLCVRPRANWDVRALLRAAPGDITAGAAAGAAVVGLSWCVQRYGLPAGSEQRAWLFQLALATEGIGSSVSVAIVGSLVLLEEWTWRGWMQEYLARRMPDAWVATAVAGLYAVVHIPTCLSLSDAQAGPNPLLVLAAFCLGWVLSVLRRKTTRLVPCLVAHGVFAYLSVTWLLPI